MHRLFVKMPQLCSSAVVASAVMLMALLCACAPRAQEQWNSYYYGSTPPMESSGVTYYGGVDADDNYTLPPDMVPAEERNLQVETLLHGNRMQ